MEVGALIGMQLHLFLISILKRPLCRDQADGRLLPMSRLGYRKRTRVSDASSSANMRAFSADRHRGGVAEDQADEAHALQALILPAGRPFLTLALPRHAR